MDHLESELQAYKESYERAQAQLGSLQSSQAQMTETLHTKSRLWEQERMSLEARLHQGEAEWSASRAKMNTAALARTALMRRRHSQLAAATAAATARVTALTRGRVNPGTSSCPPNRVV